MKTTSYWLENIHKITFNKDALPKSVEVAIVGGGYSGVSSALELARDGVQVALIDKKWPGYGACSRNLGLVVERVEGAISEDLDGTISGIPRHELLKEGQRAHDFVEDLIEFEKISAGLRRRGKLVLAHTKFAFDKMTRQLEALQHVMGSDYGFMVAKRDLASEIGEEAVRYYAGAKVLPNLVDINPGKLIAGLLDKLLQTDAYVFGGTECFSIKRSGSGKFEINSNRGRLLADQVVIATQGYSGVASHELAHKIFPFLAHVVATEPIDPALMSKLLPTLRGVVDTKQMFSNFRPCDQESRLILASHYLRTDGEEVQAARIMSYYRKLFPSLKNIGVTHCWAGNLALTADGRPHIGSDNGIHYCATGNISMAIYLGSKIAKRILGADDSETILDQLPFNKFPLYRGKPKPLYFLLRAIFKTLDIVKIPSLK